MKITELEDFTPDYLMGLGEDGHSSMYPLFHNDITKEELFDASVHIMNVYDEAISRVPFGRKQDMIDRADMDIREILTGPVLKILREEYSGHIQSNREIRSITISDESDYCERITGTVKGEPIEFVTFDVGRYGNFAATEKVERISLANQIKIEDEKGNCFFVPDEGLLRDTVRMLNGQ